MLTSKDREEASLLALAVSSGNSNTFEIVLETVTDCLTKDEVCYVLHVQMNNWTLGCRVLVYRLTDHE